MANTPGNVRVGVTGVLYVAPTGSTAPANASTMPDAAFKDLGLMGEPGLTFQPVAGGDATPLKAWQNGQTVRTMRTASTDLPTWKFIPIETSLEVIKLWLDVVVTSAAADGSFEYKVQNRSHKAFIFDVVDGAELIRHYLPNGTVTDVGEQVFSGSDAVGYEITVAGEFDAVKGYNFKGFYTALKT